MTIISRDEIKFTLFGPLRVQVAGNFLTIASPCQRIILATLLLNPNTVVSLDRIAGFVWDDELPPSASATIRTYVMRLRKALGKEVAARLETRSPGYVLRVGAEETDVLHLINRRERARALIEAGEAARASAELDAALWMYRDEPLLDVPSATLREVEVHRLQELRMQTLKWHIDIDLSLHRDAELLPKLWRLVAENPLREAFVAQLMLALSRTGQQREALELFIRVRAALVDQVGTEPGAELREMHARVLGAEPPRTGASRKPVLIGPSAAKSKSGGRDVARCATSPVSAGATVPRQPGPHRILPPPKAVAISTQREHRPPLVKPRIRPAQLPADVPDFIAREELVRALTRELTTVWPTSPPATVLSGAGGVGKTALAVHVGHLLRPEFPDGQLYMNLGAKGDATPGPAKILCRLLAALDVPEPTLPADLDQLASLYRSLVADRRLLVVLDGVRTAAEVRALLPGGRQSRLLVTSRARLPDLEAARVVDIPYLTESASLQMLGVVIGFDRVTTEPEVARRLARLTGGHPLAIRIIAARIMASPSGSLARFEQRLRDSPSILDELRIGDLAVRTSFDESYETLRGQRNSDHDLTSVLRMLGTLDAPEISLDATATLLRCDPDTAEDVLDALLDAHFVEFSGPGRYRLPNLVRAYVRTRAEMESEGEPSRHCNLQCPVDGRAMNEKGTSVLRHLPRPHIVDLRRNSGCIGGTNHTGGGN